VWGLAGIRVGERGEILKNNLEEFGREDLGSKVN